MCKVIRIGYERGLPRAERQAVLKRLAALLLMALAAPAGMGRRLPAGGGISLLPLPAHAVGARTGVAEKHRRADGGVFHSGRNYHQTPDGRVRSHRAAPARAATWWASSVCCASSACARGCARCRRRRGCSNRAPGCGAAARLDQTAGADAGHADGLARRPDRVRGGPRPGHRRGGAARAGHHALRQRPDRVRAQPGSHRHGPRRAAVDRRGGRPVPGRLGRRSGNPAAQGRGRALRRRACGHRRAAPRRGPAARLGAPLRRSAPRGDAEARRGETAGGRERGATGVGVGQRGQHHQCLAQGIPGRPARGGAVHRSARW